MTNPYTPPASSPGDEKAAAAQAPRSPAKPAIAAVLSLLALGAGHVYAGRAVRGLRWYGALMVAAPCAWALFRPAYLALGLGGLGLCALLPLGIHVATAVDAARQARGRPRVAIWIIVVGLVGFCIAPAPLASVLRPVFLEAFKIPAGSVLPTLAVGDHLFVDKLWPRMRRARRGELVVFPLPEHPNQDFVKRVVALAGETVRVEGARLFINGWQVPRCDVGRWSYDDESSRHHEGGVAMEFLGDAAYLVFDDEAAPVQPEPPVEWRVRAGQLFVLGDNRNNSYDSRLWNGGQGGGVPARTVGGFALTVWLSMTRDRRVDWRRIGADLTGRRPLAPPGLEEGVARCLANRPHQTVEPPS